MVTWYIEGRRRSRRLLFPVFARLICATQVAKHSNLEIKIISRCIRLRHSTLTAVASQNSKRMCVYPRPVPAGSEADDKRTIVSDAEAGVDSLTAPALFDRTIVYTSFA